MTGRMVFRDAGFALPLHRHDDARIVIVLDGEVRETDVTGARTYRKGEFLFRPPYCAHANAAPPSPVSYMRLPVTHGVWTGLAAQYGWRAMGGRLDFENRAERALLRLKCGDALAQRLGEQKGDARRGDAEFRRDPAAMRVIAGEPLRAVAAAMGLQPYQLTRLFLRRYGLTPTAFRREARLRRAFAMLAGSNAGLADIAAACGYADQSHFTREIKSAAGCSPRALRDAMGAA